MNPSRVSPCRRFVPGRAGGFAGRHYQEPYLFADYTSWFHRPNPVDAFSRSETGPAWSPVPFPTGKPYFAFFSSSRSGSAFLLLTAFLTMMSTGVTGFP